MHSTIILATLATYALALNPGQNFGNTQLGNQPGYPNNQYPLNGQQQGMFGNQNQYPFGSQNQYPFGNQNQNQYPFGNQNQYPFGNQNQNQYPFGNQNGQQLPQNWQCLFQNQGNQNPFGLPTQQVGRMCTSRTQCTSGQMCCAQSQLFNQQQQQQQTRPIIPLPTQQVFGRCQTTCPVGSTQL